MGAPTTSEGGHKVDITVRPAHDNSVVSELQVTATVVFTVRDPVELHAVGELPLRLRCIIGMNREGAVKDFFFGAVCMVQPSESPQCPSKCDSDAKAPHADFNSDKYTFDGETHTYGSVVRCL